MYRKAVQISSHRFLDIYSESKRSTLCQGDGLKRPPEVAIANTLVAAHEENTSQPNNKLFDVCFGSEMCICLRDDNISDVQHGEGHLEKLELRVLRNLRPTVVKPPSLVKSSSCHVLTACRRSAQVPSGAGRDSAPTFSGRGSLLSSAEIPCSRSSATSLADSPRPVGTWTDGLALDLDSRRLRF